ncbi:MAG: 50S ribosomal protein L19 [Victivallales bacterium]|nr:50S ribosomal protein L19 [Victivallales bacterium]MCF7889547.1 50S ribosomal protein L19 [Victivallales bacterium]
MNKTMDKINKEQCRTDLPDFKAGDTVRVHAKIVEGKTERIQTFTGTVISRQGSGIQEFFVVRRIAFGQGMERGYPLNSPRIAKIDILRRGKVRRSKLYYLRDRIGKAAKVKEKRH